VQQQRRLALSVGPHKAVPLPVRDSEVRAHTPAYVSLPSASMRIRQHTSAYVSIRRIRQHSKALVCLKPKVRVVEERLACYTDRKARMLTYADVC
jgi:hypothetical protein